ncbi:disulfide bond formation protein B [Roseiflexus sp.]|uniref:disulfide bond formation protein B n=1 Tax=Roseiflexus sp. TaxID=2562120 RepID=UPI0021DC0A35|nr:disulfide bond formation protein B [Roseiflexus sp.]GIW01054.1 MAG: disulfide bond formation protein DsbB [Roseiflexus sp.]
MSVTDTPSSIAVGEVPDGPIQAAEEDRLSAFFASYGRHLALLQAIVATCGSLFMSEALGWPPCVLCWYQRILMYPLVALILIGILRRDRGLHLYVLPLSLSGACISLYHYLLVKTDWLPPPPCVDGIPCTVDYLDILGFINVPFMALTAFLIISFLMGATAVSIGTRTEATPSLRDRQAIAAYAIIVLVAAAFIGWGIIV